MLKGLREAARGHEDILIDVRGMGLMLALEFVDDATGFEISKYLFDRGILVAGTLVNARVIRVEPPLVIAQAQADRVCEVLADALKAMPRGRALSAAR